MTNASDDIAFLRAQADRDNDGSFFVLLYDFCYFDKKIFKKRSRQKRIRSVIIMSQMKLTELLKL